MVPQASKFVEGCLHGRQEGLLKVEQINIIGMVEDFAVVHGKQGVAKGLSHVRLYKSPHVFDAAILSRLPLTIKRD